MEVGDVISGFTTEKTVTLHIIESVESDTMSIRVEQFEPDSDQYDWAIDQLAALGE